MGEHSALRRRPSEHAASAAIDDAWSRGRGAAPPPRQRTRKKSKTNKRAERGHHHHAKVNPIFVWIRQENTRIVDVKCEDYDKRNRILLTKTPQGWRATPRTETLATTAKTAEPKKHHHHHHHHHHKKKSKRHKVRQKSTGVQVEDQQLEGAPIKTNDYPDWESPVNVESLLPSHTISRKTTSSPVNSDVNSSAQTLNETTTTVSPLETLLSVAELEFNQQLNDEEWNHDEKNDQTFLEDMDNLSTFIDSCNEDAKSNYNITKDESDYDEEEENNIAMDDILNRLEQSLRSPESPETKLKKDETKDVNPEQDVVEITSNEETEVPEPSKEPEEITDPPEEIKETHEPTEEIQEITETPTTDDKTEEPIAEDTTELEKIEEKQDKIEEPIIDLSLKKQPNVKENEQPTDLSVKTKPSEEIVQPTDLTMRKPLRSLTPIIRPPSQNSEALQLPEPSGLPAVPPSPDLTSPNVQKNKPRFLESLLVTSTANQKEPLDLGKCRKSASPTITCSEDKSETEPPPKKLKINEPTTLKNLLSDDNSTEDPLTQLKNLLSDQTVNVPDPMLVPKEHLSKIISNPSVEIMNLLKNRPELRLPEALAFPHLLQDPDILVITLNQLETIIKKQSSEITLKNVKKPDKKESKSGKNSKNDLANDIDVATNAAFNPMFWLPYFNQMESRNPELSKVFPSSVYPTPELNLMGNQFTPPNFMQPPMNYNNLEMNFWQEAMMQANVLRPKFSMEDLNTKLNNNVMNNKISNYRKFNHANFQNFPNFEGAQDFPYHMKNRTPMAFNLFSQQPKTADFSKNFSHPSALHQFSSRESASHKMEQGSIRTKPSYKLMPNSAHHVRFADHQHHGQRHHHQQNQLMKGRMSESHRPIDLSDRSEVSGKYKVKSQESAIRKLMKSANEEVGEVGSTTASIEEMQEAHKHLWHPLFGNEKGYNNNWNWAPISATAE